MKKAMIYVITVVLTAIGTVCTLNVISAKAEEATVECTTVAEVVAALTKGCESVVYDGDGIYIHYTLEEPVSSAEYEYFLTMLEEDPDYKAELQAELDEAGWTWSDLRSYFMEPHYSKLEFTILSSEGHVVY